MRLGLGQERQATRCLSQRRRPHPTPPRSAQPSRLLRCHRWSELRAGRTKLLQPCLEQPGAARRRPANVFIPSWSAALHFTITSPQRLDAPPEAVTISGAAAEAYERHNCAYLATAEDCATLGLQLRPIVRKPSGGCVPSAMCTFIAIVSRPKLPGLTKTLVQS